MASQLSKNKSAIGVAAAVAATVSAVTVIAMRKKWTWWKKSTTAIDAASTCHKGVVPYNSAPFSVAGQIVVVTGAGSGIGRATAIEFVRAGAYVVCADYNFVAANETVDICHHEAKTRASSSSVPSSSVSSLPIAIAVNCDVTSVESVQSLVATTVATYGNGVNTLVNNAGIQVNKLMVDTLPTEWNRMIETNLGGCFLCSKYFFPHIKAAKGSIINMGSINATITEYQCAGYCASKGAIMSFTRALAIDHGRDGVRVNCVCPGYIDAGLAWGYFESQPDPAAARAESGKLHALWRIGLPEEVGRTCVFLASPASSFITGAQIPVDGGMSAGLPPKA